MHAWLNEALSAFMILKRVFDEVWTLNLSYLLIYQFCNYYDFIAHSFYMKHTELALSIVPKYSE